MSPPAASAVVQRGPHLSVEAIELPTLKEHQVYVRVECAAFNPTDRLAFDLNAFGDGAVLGCDFAGVVTQIHPSVTKLAIGDRVAALVWGGEIKGLGAYSTVSIADERLAYKIPSNLDFAQACSLPVAVNTAWLALFSKDCLSLRSGSASGTPHILVWGGSSAVGYFAIQIAKIYGFLVSTTCSPRNFEQARQAGATHVFDYNDEDVVSKLKAMVPDVTHVFDTIGNLTSSATATQVLDRRPGTLCTVRPGKANTECVQSNVRVTDVFVFTAFPSPHSYRGLVHWPIHMEDHRLSAELYSQLPDLLTAQSLRPLPVTVLGELSPAAVAEAMKMNREGRISGQKLCFKVPVKLDISSR